MADINFDQVRTPEDEERERKEAELARELEEERQKQTEAIGEFVIEQVTRMIEADELSEDQKNRFLSVYPPFTPGAAYRAGDKVRFRGVVYEVIQEHTAQADWFPPDTPALFRVFEQTQTTDPETGDPVEVVPEFKQPTGGRDAYNKGDKVNYNGAIYESTMDGNVWTPDAYPAGWRKIN